jgi:hypothetical protein
MQVIPAQSRVSARNSGRFSPSPPDRLRVKTSFQETPGNGYYFVLLHDERPLVEQVETLRLRDGDPVILWEPDCGDFTVEAVLLFDFKHPMMLEPGLWATAKLPNSDSTPGRGVFGS